MPDPFTIAAVGGLVLSEGIKFLYNQASDIIKRWRDRRNKQIDASAEIKLPEKEFTSAPVAEVTDIFEGKLAPLEIHYDQVEKVHEPLNKLRKELLDYQEGTLPVDKADQNLIKNIDALRQTLELVYQQRITFKGEDREPSGPKVITIVDVKQVLGEVLGIDVDEIASGSVETNVKADLVGPGGKLTGARIKKIGG